MTIHPIKIIDHHNVIRETIGYEGMSDLELIDIPQVMDFLRIVYNYKRLKEIEKG